MLLIVPAPDVDDHQARYHRVAVGVGGEGRVSEQGLKRVVREVEVAIDIKRELDERRPAKLSDDRGCSKCGPDLFERMTGAEYTASNALVFNAS